MAYSKDKLHMDILHNPRCIVPHYYQSTLNPSICDGADGIHAVFKDYVHIFFWVEGPITTQETHISELDQNLLWEVFTIQQN